MKQEKSVETIIQLSKNPHYVLSTQEIAILRQYQMENNKELMMNRNVLAKHSAEVPKNNTQIKE